MQFVVCICDKWRRDWYIVFRPSSPFQNFWIRYWTGLLAFQQPKLCGSCPPWFTTPWLDACPRRKIDVNRECKVQLKEAGKMWNWRCNCLRNFTKRATNSLLLESFYACLFLLHGVFAPEWKPSNILNLTDLCDRHTKKYFQLAVPLLRHCYFTPNTARTGLRIVRTCSTEQRPPHFRGPSSRVTKNYDVKVAY